MTRRMRAMNTPVATFVVLPSDIEADVAGLANTHAAFAAGERRVVRFDQSATSPDAVVALFVRSDGTVCAALTRAQALDEAWIEDGFVRTARKQSCTSD